MRLYYMIEENFEKKWGRKLRAVFNYGSKLGTGLNDVRSLTDACNILMVYESLPICARQDFFSDLMELRLAAIDHCRDGQRTVKTRSAVSRKKHGSSSRDANATGQSSQKSSKNTSSKTNTMRCVYCFRDIRQCDDMTDCDKNPRGESMHYFYEKLPSNVAF